MTLLPTAYIASTGVTRLAHHRTGGTGGWLFVFVPSSDWVGSIILKKNTAAPSTIGSPSSSNLTAVAYTDQIQNTPAQGGVRTVSAGVPITGAKAIVVPLPDYTVWADVAWQAGSMTVQALSYDAQPVTTAANLSQLTIDAVPLGYPEDLAFQLRLAGGLS